jgi:flagellar basal body-associated protein FliL
VNDIDDAKKIEEKELEKGADEAAETPELAEIAELKDLEDLDADYAPPLKIKEYLNSTDAPSRYLMTLSILFGMLAAFCLSLLIFEYWHYRHNAQKLVGPAVKTIKLEPGFSEDMGEFKIDWDDAEMRAELVAECSSKETCEEIKARNIEARDLIFPVLQNSSRSEILNPNQKLYLRQQLANKLNELELSGSILQVDFSDLTIEPKK